MRKVKLYQTEVRAANFFNDLNKRLKSGAQLVLDYIQLHAPFDHAAGSAFENQEAFHSHLCLVRSMCKVHSVLRARFLLYFGPGKEQIMVFNDEWNIR